MQNALITRWKLTPVEKFEDFLRDMVIYLKKTLMSFELSDEKITYPYNEYPDDFSDEELLEGIANFCLERNLDLYEVLKMIKDYADDLEGHECTMMEDEKIMNLVGRD